MSKVRQYSWNAHSRSLNIVNDRYISRWICIHRSIYKSLPPNLGIYKTGPHFHEQVGWGPLLQLCILLNSFEPQTLQWRRKSLVSSCCLRSTAGLVRETWRGRGQPGGGFWYEYSSENPGGVDGVLEWHWAKQPVGGPWTHSSTWRPGAHTTTCDWWTIFRKPVIGGQFLRIIFEYWDDICLHLFCQVRLQWWQLMAIDCKRGNLVLRYCNH